VNAAMEKARFLRALAFEIRRKLPPDDALAECIGKEGRGGRHRLFRQISIVLESDGFVPALLAAEMVGAEASAILTTVAEANDHRLLASAINTLADFQEQQA
jgi:hypothetical protein